MPEAVAKSGERNKRRWADPEYRQKTSQWRKDLASRRGATYQLKKSRARLQAIVIEWKQQGCTDCGYSDVRAMEPDHVDPREKYGNVSRMVQMCASSQRIRDELAKCVPRCIRCHRWSTSQQLTSVLRSGKKIPPSWQRRVDHQDLIDRLKLGQGCMDCGWAGWARGLDFDHVRGVKIAPVSSLIANNRPWLDIVTELLKCECVCANCHRIRTIERLRVKAREAAERRPSAEIAGS